MLSKNNIIQVTCLTFILLLNLLFIFLGIQPIYEYFKNINDISFVNYNWPLVFTWFIDLVATIGLIGFTIFSIKRIKVSKIEYKNLLLSYFGIYVVLKFILNVVYYINLSRLVNANFLFTLSTGAVINFVISLIILLTYIVLKFLKLDKFILYTLSAELIILILLDLIFPIFYNKYIVGEVPLGIIYILFIIFSLVMNLLETNKFSKKVVKGEEAYEK